jgi:hypothetical protein
VDSIAQLLDQASTLPINSDARKRLEKRVLNETEITNFNQVAALVEAVAIHQRLKTAPMAMRTQPRRFSLKRKPYLRRFASYTT